MSCDKKIAPDVLEAQARRGPLKFHMKLASDARLLSVVRSTVSEFAAVCGFDDRQCRCLTLAVDEALSNVIRHAYKNECGHDIELTCEARPDCLEFAFLDHGEPADPARFCARPLDEVALGGRGTQLIRQIMDEVCYERVLEGNRLCLRKRLPDTGTKSGLP